MCGRVLYLSFVEFFTGLIFIGIFAYLNFLCPRSRQEIVEILVKGLQRLEYRGYDSAGIGIDGDKLLEHGESEILLLKNSGKVKALEEEIFNNHNLDMNKVYETHAGIAHTRWATHGQPNWVNAHPQTSSDDNAFIIVHNGIITNYKDIKAYLEKKGYVFSSETDTEVIVKLMHHIYKRNSDLKFRQVVEHVIRQISGAFAIVCKSVYYPGELVAARRGSPLLVGIRSKNRLATDQFPVYYSKSRGTFLSFSEDENSTTPGIMNSSFSLPRFDSTTEFRPMTVADVEAEYYFASDASAVIEHTKQVIFLEDDDVASVEDGMLSIHHSKYTSGSSKDTREVQMLNMEIQEIMKGNYRTFMQKEIFEQPESVFNTMRGRINFKTSEVVLGGIKSFLSEIKRCRRLIMIACGTSYHSSVASRQIVEELTELPVMIELASDFLDRQTPIFRDDVCFFISQSGETADTLNALRYCKLKGALIVGITNVVGSSICRESHCGVHINAGPEIGVASTKAYTSQILTLVLFALVVSDDRISMQKRRLEIINALERLPNQIRQALSVDDRILELAKEIYKMKSMLVMGRGYNFATCLEAALKVKELSYMHCEGIMSGELKHGPLAMVDNNLLIIMVLCKDRVYHKSLNALQQVLARDGKPIIVCDDSVPEEDLNGLKHVIRVPHTTDCLQNVLSIVPFQLLSYHLAELNGRNVDRPRNLAKSVTVE